MDHGAHAASTKARSAVDRIVIKKGAHTMELFEGANVVGSYRVAIGPGGAGVKHQQGDNVTPVGRYHVVSRSPSRYHVFMRLDYPNASDRARFAKAVADGTLPKGAQIGGDIGIHGAPPQPEWKNLHKTVDWTAGCIAVDDDEIEKVAAAVDDGTIVDIED
ncbi:MAG TPA: L,D-transpeptidase family protein [Polyangiaceae bacterium]